MIDVIFYTNFSKRKNSTLRPTGGDTLSCNIKSDCSLLNPTIEVKERERPTYNYAYISDFGRYYWVTDWTWLQGLWVASLRVDVLATWRGYIGATNAYVTRSSVESDGYITDTYYPATNKKRIVQARFESAGGYLSAADLWDTTMENNKGIFILDLNGCGNVKNIGPTSHYAMTPNMLANFTKKLMDYESVDDTPFNWLGEISDLSNNLFKSMFNPLQYITACRYIPIDLDQLTYFPFESSGHDENLFMGNWQISGLAFYKPTSTYIRLDRQITLPRQIPRTQNNMQYLNFSPFTEYYLHIEPWGTIPLDPASLQHSDTIALHVHIDFFTGDAELTISALSGTGAETYEVFRGNSKVAIDVSLAQITSDPLAVKKAENAQTNLIFDTIKSGMHLDLVGVAQNVATGYEDAEMDVFGSRRPMVNQTSGAGGTLIGLWHPTLYAEYATVVERDIPTTGQPLCKNRVIQNLGGYIQCMHPDDFVIPCFDAEKVEIDQFVTSGFFYE